MLPQRRRPPEKDGTTDSSSLNPKTRSTLTHLLCSSAHNLNLNLTKSIHSLIFKSHQPRPPPPFPPSPPPPPPSVVLPPFPLIFPQKSTAFKPVEASSSSSTSVSRAASSFPSVSSSSHKKGIAFQPVLLHLPQPLAPFLPPPPTRKAPPLMSYSIKKALVNGDIVLLFPIGL